MLDYRCYRLDPQGHVTAVHAFAAPNDAIAADIVRTADWARECDPPEFLNQSE
jgi:hypothetical protein